jgi:hypothetical protein
LKNALKIATTNWIHILGFYAMTYVSFILFRIIGIEGYNGQTWDITLFLSLATIPLLFFTYGLLIIFYFYASIIIIDIIAFKWTKLETKQILLIEWIVIIPPFIFWAFKYEYWLWLTLALSFLLTQFYRKRQIEKIKNNVA